MVKHIFLFLIIASALTYCTSDDKPVLLFVEDVKTPLLSLDGEWEFTLKPPVNFYKINEDEGLWAGIEVPGEPAMQGYPVLHDQPVAYKKTIMIPADYAGKKVYLRFDGVYSYARVWVNGHFIRDHKGGFTRWYCDITEFADPGKEALIAVEVTDKIDDISYGSGYAKHPIGGILRSVFLEARPKIRLDYWRTETDLDPDYKDAILHVDLKAVFDIGESTSATIRLFDPLGKEVLLKNNTAELSKETPDNQLEIFVKNPEKWNAEHPALYTVQCMLTASGRQIWAQSKKIGFREVERSGNKLLVNGKEVKLRGACRHDIHPLLGRVGTRMYDSLDVLLAREANINFIRTSHYPPTEAFVDFCDRYGIYVECESAVCFVGTHRSGKYSPGASENDPAFRDQYVSQIEEMTATFRDHPSVIIWSLGNESRYGSNIAASWNRIDELDSTRPVIYSYPGLIPDSLDRNDILSMHYPGYNGELEQYGKRTNGFSSSGNIPVLFDEWAHVACYNTATLKRDPNVRDFWGKSLDRMWYKCFLSKSGLGGAIWGYVDETFMLPDTCTGYGEWGIIDAWRRKKPEFWNTKKAYSPFKLPLRYSASFRQWEELKMPVFNRFDHTNLKDLTITWDVGSQYGTIEATALNIPPHSLGELILPAREWKKGEVVYIEAKLNGQVVDKYDIVLGAPPETPPELIINAGVAPLVLEEDGDNFIIVGENFAVVFSSIDGLIHNISASGGDLLQEGPYLHFKGKVINKKGNASGVRLQNIAGLWRLDHIKKKVYDDSAQIDIYGKAGSLSVYWKIRINKQGIMDVNYNITGLQEVQVAELGVRWKLHEGYDSLAWKRRTYWSLYPEGHLGMPVGKTALYNTLSEEEYRTPPESTWSMDTKNYFLFGKDYSGHPAGMTNMAKALKENIYYYHLSDSKNHKNLTVLSGGRLGCRVRAVLEHELELVVNDLWDYTNLGWGNYMRNIQIKGHFEGQIRLYFNKLNLSGRD